MYNASDLHDVCILYLWTCCILQCDGKSVAAATLCQHILTRPGLEKHPAIKRGHKHIPCNCALGYKETDERKTWFFWAVSFFFSINRLLVLTCAVILSAVPNASHAHAKIEKRHKSAGDVKRHTFISCSHSPNTATLLEHLSLYVRGTMVNTGALRGRDASPVL